MKLKKSSVALACFLPSCAKDSSEPLYIANDSDISDDFFSVST